MSHDHPTVKAKAHLTQAGDAEALRKAMKGLGTDEDTIVDVLTSCNSDQRQLLYQQYNRAYDRDLTKDLKKELSGNLEDIIMALMTSHKDY
ncbi:annexin, partial [Escherichia coli]